MEKMKYFAYVEAFMGLRIKSTILVLFLSLSGVFR